MNFPGLIDLQINGYIGIDFSSPDLTEADAIRAFEAIVKSGARGFFPTIVTSPLALFERNLPILARAMSDRIWGKHALGIHVEGPFLCPLPGYIGAHKPEWALDPDPELLRQFQVWADGKIRILTMAAGQPGADELAKKLFQWVFPSSWPIRNAKPRTCWRWLNTAQRPSPTSATAFRMSSANTKIRSGRRF